MSIYSIRGAISVNEDTPKEISLAAVQLFQKIMEINGLTSENLIQVLISHTVDLRSSNSATALRKAGFCQETSLFCVQEADIENAMPRVIRMMILVSGLEKKPENVYLGQAALLRAK